ncbi:MAG: hypothetical protein OZSIB_1639 [Candidatus Ozemobacter sibiricus]|uniref:Prepilin-type N-terminal cleavage/methylation domain-containing protein n=1 Tax=Candidatus Ozemobacter sibiricus TaxID=2268124 RepID=A0A367ZLH5_9BACT|nr:MAG: hypothetical protein OZSIB_1639 [Candidatus Ozemobacter sibiricus]
MTGFTLTELMVALAVGVLALALAFTAWRWLQRTSQENRTRDAAGHQMRLLHEVLRADAVAASAWRWDEEGRRLEIEGTVDPQGRLVPLVTYHFDDNARRVTRDDGRTPRVFAFAEATHGRPSFAFALTFLDEARRQVLPPDRARVLRVALHLGVPGGGMGAAGAGRPSRPGSGGGSDDEVRSSPGGVASGGPGRGAMDDQAEHLTFTVTRSSRFSAEVPGGDLVWQDP